VSAIRAVDVVDSQDHHMRDTGTDLVITARATVGLLSTR
jgi:hypothetical protein